MQATRFLRFAVLAVSLTLSACGWHLRGTGDNSAVGYKVYVKQVQAETVGYSLYTALNNRGAQLVSDRAESDVVIEVIGQRYRRRILSVDPDSGKVREIELGLTTDFVMRAGDGTLLIPRETLNWELDYIFDEGSVLGTREQDTVVQRDLADIAATSIVLRMQSVKIAHGETVSGNATQR